MTTKNLVSIIIPAFNAEVVIKGAIESVLAQRYNLLEVIVVDDGSTDDTAAIARAFGPPVSCYSQKNGGAAAARNLGLSLARGEFIGFLDSDDVYVPGRLTLQLKKLQSNPEIAAVIGRLAREQLTSNPGEPLAFKPLPPDEHINLSFGVCLFRRSAFDRVGMLEESLRHTEDWDWFMRAREMQLPMLLHDDIILRVRLHWNNLTRDQEAGRHFLPIMLKRSIDRRRSLTGKAESLANLAEAREKPTNGRNR